jgi:PTS system fructose-specific IIB component
MNIVCVAACTAGIAHTYIAREKLIKGARALGHNVKVETQGTIGTENELQQKISLPLTLLFSL